MSMPTPDADEIIIDGWRFKVVGGVVNVQNLATFQRKTVIGDYTRDSNPVLSTWVLTDFSGGHGVQALEEGADAARYRFGVVDARRPRQITCPPLTVSSPSTRTARSLASSCAAIVAKKPTPIFSSTRRRPGGPCPLIAEWRCPA